MKTHDCDDIITPEFEKYVLEPQYDMSVLYRLGFVDDMPPIMLLEMLETYILTRKRISTTTHKMLNHVETIIKNKIKNNNVLRDFCMRKAYESNRMLNRMLRKCIIEQI